MKLLKLFISAIILINSFLLEEVFAQNNNAFLNPPEIIVLPEKADNHSAKNREFTGIPSLAISNGGRMWAVWYAGITPDEDENNYVVVSSSPDGGDAWEEILIIDPDGAGPVRAFDPEIWIDPDGKLWVFWAQSMGHDGSIAGVWSVTTDNPNIEDPIWSKPRRLTDGVMMCKPMVLSSGEWVLPASTWRFTDNSAKIIISKDKGRSWHERGAVNVPKEDRAFDEQIIIERKDGSLWMLLRTKYGIGESVSRDRGKSWSPLVSSKIMHPSARFFIRKLKSGNILLVKHGPIDIKTKRSHLMAFISMDDGHSWSHGLLLDQRNNVSYPDGQQVADGTIHIVYDYNRRTDQNVITTSFLEEDILASDYDRKIYKTFKHRKIVSKGGIDFLK